MSTPQTAVDAAPSSRRRGLRAFGVAFAALFSLTVLWSLASPLMSGPDEQSHMIKAGGVAYGQPAGADAGEPGWRYFDVPSYFAQTEHSLCYVFKADQPASCITDIDGSNADLVPVRSAAGTYNPVYYALVGWPALLLEDEAAFHAMRVASAFVVSLVMASGIGALAARRRFGWSLTAALVAVTPMVLFLSGTVNPSSLELACGFALAAWLSLLADPDRRETPLVPVLGVVVTAALLVNTRSVGMVWAIVIIGVALIDPALWTRLARRWYFWAGAGVIGVAAVAAFAWTQTAGATEVRDALEGAGETTFAKGFEFMISITLQNAGGYIGVFGWLDTPLPPTAVSLWGGLMVAMVLAAIVYGRGWGRLRIVAMTLAFVLLPAFIQGASWNEFGFIWQARYFLAIVLALIVLAGGVLDESVPQPNALPRSRSLAAVLVALLGGIQVFAFMWALKRYVTGTLEGKGWTLMWSAPAWQPPLTWPVLLAALLVALAAAYGAYILATTRRPAAGRAPAPADAAPPVPSRSSAAEDRATIATPAPTASGETKEVEA